MNPLSEHLIEQAQNLTDQACALGIDTLVVFRTHQRGLYSLEHHVKERDRKIIPEYMEVASMHPRVISAAVWVHRVMCRIHRITRR